MTIIFININIVLLYQVVLVRIMKVYYKGLILFLVSIHGCSAGYSNPDNSGDTYANAYILHKKVVVTVFWIGEDASLQNEYITNTESSWDSRWVEHYGGVDDPLNRQGYFPESHEPLENPFYFALPYNDFNHSGRKPSAYRVVPWSKTRSSWGSNESMCKNRWIKIIKGKKVAYAQWQDVGPFSDDDAEYVFGTAKPVSKINQGAGLDVSPAVRDYLKLEDIDVVDWVFVDDKDVPDGPWKLIVTTSPINWDK
ncbi:MAG: hypothetical protein LJE83_08885 [Gammaproteobacteria bacterium]|nr:hypothetical protein [Gammaproteobacteria bacterium]